MATSAVPVVEDRVKLLAESITSEDSFEHIDACFDGEYEELKGRATADFLPLEKDEILLQEGKQTFPGGFAVGLKIFNSPYCLGTYVYLCVLLLYLHSSLLH